ncbi:hypothetical protein GO986_18775 [Deinococcus sp. HMF7620]|uniref:Uncharacterized protein n=1 Tax=Deinococcus arboris TaxID=2682977 RepID=A0A7C9HU67_9DEIO|nr:hypothetical protein [Deinococcus arboris]MVN88787.1 hypothetical protein [Deinococcus arboris]
MRRAFWALPDAEIWAEADAAWLLEAFRQSELAEAPRAHLPIGCPQELADAMDDLLRRWAEKGVQRVGLTLHEMDALHAELCGRPAPAQELAASLRRLLARPARHKEKPPPFQAALSASRTVRVPLPMPPRRRQHRRQRR